MTYYFQNPRSGWPMVLKDNGGTIVRFEVEAEETPEAEPKKNDLEDAREYQRVVQHCDDVHEAARFLRREFHCEDIS